MKYFIISLCSLTVIGMLLFGYFHHNQAASRMVKVTNLSMSGGDSPWKGRNWYAIGDSITYANKYQPIVQKGLDIRSVVTDAVPGQAIGTMADRVTVKQLKQSDLITIFGGTNDYGSNKVLGTIHDPKDKNTFYGNLKKVIEKVLADKPADATVVLFTPLKRGAFKNQAVYPEPNAAGYKLEDYVKAEKEVCRLYSIPVIDLFHQSGLEIENLKRYTRDNLHPNDAGYAMISKVIIRELKNIKP